MLPPILTLVASSNMIWGKAGNIETKMEEILESNQGAQINPTTLKHSDAVTT